MATMQVKVDRGAETSGFLMSDPQKFGQKGSVETGSVISGFFPNNGEVQQEVTPFSAGKGAWGSFTTLAFWIVTIIGMVIQAVGAIQKLTEVDEKWDDSSSGYDPTLGVWADFVAAGYKCDRSKESTASPGGTCHKYMHYEPHMNFLLLMLAILPFVFLIVNIAWYGCVPKPMTFPKNTAYGTVVGTVLYAHIIFITLANALMFWYIADSDIKGSAQSTVDDNAYRHLAEKSTTADPLFTVAFIFNAFILAGMINLPLSALAVRST